MTTTDLKSRLAALPEWPGAYQPERRSEPLEYLVCAADCVVCGARVSGDWGLVPDLCDRCLAEGEARHYRRVADAALARLELLREFLTDIRGVVFDPYDASELKDVIDALLAKTEVPRE